jgi:hypothetical protein
MLGWLRRMRLQFKEWLYWRRAAKLADPLKGRRQ